MLTEESRCRVEDIIHRLKQSETVSLEERIYISKLSKISKLVEDLLNRALSKEAQIIDEDIS